MPTPKQQRRRALELLEASIDGCTEAIMLAYGFKSERKQIAGRSRAFVFEFEILSRVPIGRRYSLCHARGVRVFHQSIRFGAPASTGRAATLRA
jgi:hypothetical protein